MGKAISHITLRNYLLTLGVPVFMLSIIGIIFCCLI